MKRQPLTVVWFKRDLRIADHRPLAKASARGRVLPLYVVETEYWALPDTSYRQWKFFEGAIQSLERELSGLGGTLDIRVGNVVQVLDSLKEQHGHFELIAHEETGNGWTFDRDRAVHRWCGANRVSFTELPQFGVSRGSSLDRNKWAQRWDAMMQEPVEPVPSITNWEPIEPMPLPSAKELGLADDGIQSMQTPGRAAALETLESFLRDRGETYQKDMSSPVAGETACSRLSPHLMAGSLSMREAYQAALTRQSEVAGLSREDKGKWPSAMKSFIGRLHWHCHFIQKLEAEPDIEWRPMAKVYEGLRQEPENDALLRAFETGQTGYPFVDACMRYLRTTGWLNFRMRAMLMSFASYNLWLPWQQSGMVLARLFTDYEPGIHWSQSQMQAGETGINTVRVYSPVKQGYDQDPTGDFTRRWVPELRGLDGKALQEPWTLPELPAGYPTRIVDHVQSAKEAKQRIYALRGSQEARAEASGVFEKHGSRKRRRTAKKRTKPRAVDDAQLDLFSKL